MARESGPSGLFKHPLDMFGTERYITLAAISQFNNYINELARRPHCSDSHVRVIFTIHAINNVRFITQKCECIFSSPMPEYKAKILSDAICS